MKPFLKKRLTLVMMLLTVALGVLAEPRGDPLAGARESAPLMSSRLVRLAAPVQDAGEGTGEGDQCIP